MVFMEKKGIDFWFNLVAKEKLEGDPYALYVCIHMANHRNGQGWPKADVLYRRKMVRGIWLSYAQFRHLLSLKKDQREAGWALFLSFSPALQEEALNVLLTKRQIEQIERMLPSDSLQTIEEARTEDLTFEQWLERRSGPMLAEKEEEGKRWALIDHPHLYPRERWVEVPMLKK